MQSVHVEKLCRMLCGCACISLVPLRKWARMAVLSSDDRVWGW